MHMQQQSNYRGAAPATNVATQPIVSLSPFLGNNWAVRARVTDKGQIRQWNKGDKSGELMSTTLLDDSGSIRATFFGQVGALTEVSNKLVNGNVYHFMNGSIKNANKRFSSVNNDYEINFNGMENFSGPLQDNSNDIPKDRFNFLPLEALPHREKDTLVDCLFYVKEVEEARTFNAKTSGKQTTKRTIVIADKTAIAELTLWNDDAVNNNKINAGECYILKGAKVGSYEGSASLSVWKLDECLRPITRDSDPGIMGEANKAREAATNGAITLNNVSKINRDNSNWTGEYARVPRRFFDDIQKLNIGKPTADKPNGESIDVRCMPTFIKTESLHYNACLKCKKKMQGGPGSWQCPNNACQSTEMTERYMVSIQASDGVSQQWITLFDDAGAQFFGMSAHELEQHHQKDNSWITKHCLSLLYKPMVFRLRIKQEARTDGQEGIRLNISANRCTPLNDDASFSAEIEKLEEYIALYEGAPDTASPNRGVY